MVKITALPHSIKRPEESIPSDKRGARLLVVLVYKALYPVKQKTKQIEHTKNFIRMIRTMAQNGILDCSHDASGHYYVHSLSSSRYGRHGNGFYALPRSLMVGNPTVSIGYFLFLLIPEIKIQIIDRQNLLGGPVFYPLY
jgi:hypothetical protein